MSPDYDRRAGEDPHLARIEERVEQLAKRLERQESTIERQFIALDRSIRDVINGRIEALEARQQLVRTIVYALCGGILIAFLNFVVGGWIGTHPTSVFRPSAPPAHSTRELREAPP